MPKKLVSIALTVLMICFLTIGVVGCNSNQTATTNGEGAASNSSQGDKGLTSEQVQKINPQTPQGQKQIDSQTDKDLNALDKSMDQLDKSLGNL